MKLSESIRSKVFFWHSNKQNVYIYENMHYWADRIAELEAENEKLTHDLYEMGDNNCELIDS